MTGLGTSVKVYCHKATSLVYLQWAWYIACFGSMALGAVMFAGLAYYARKRRILWIGIPAQDHHHAAIDKPRPQHSMHAPLLPASKHMSHHHY